MGEKEMEKAMKTTGLNDFGDLQFVQNYKYVTDTEFFKKLKLTNIGYVVAQKEMQVNLTKRLKIINYMKKNPQVNEIPINRPIFVFGLGKSGTTFVHRLMSLDPNLRAP